MSNKFTLSLAFSLLALFAFSAAADRSSNPWALPQAVEQLPAYQQQGYRFVTPEIIESLEQQQTRAQQVPGYYQNRQYRAPQSLPSRRPQVPAPPQVMQQLMPQLMSEPPIQTFPLHDTYGFSSPATGFTHPLTDLPSVSPWAGGPDVMYQGEQFPWLPNAAIGGIAPMNVSPFIGNGQQGEAPSEHNQIQNKVFNPFTFGSNGNL